MGLKENMQTREFEINSVEEMNELAARICEELEAGDFLLLIGELGVGKTTFVQGLAKTLGVVGRVASPTFTVMGEYETNYGKIKRLVHVDLYRLIRGTVEQDVAMNDVLEDGNKEGITVIEWADRLTVDVPGRSWQVRFKHGEESMKRVVSVKL